MNLRIPILALAIAALGFGLKTPLHRAGALVQARLANKKTVEDRLRQFADPVAERLRPDFVRAGVAYPPAQLSLLAFKDARVLELYAGGPKEGQRRIKRYPIAAASGVLGPKLREGDRQVPEGLYAIESLNPNSLYHLSLRVDYPNAFDRARAAEEGRTRLGGDIMIHGSDRSIGCLAMGDEAAEELFVLAALAGVENVRVIISPTDFRSGAPAPELPASPAWVPELHAALRAALDGYD